VNWFLNPDMKVQWNVAVDHRDPTPQGSTGWTYILGTRLASWRKPLERSPCRRAPLSAFVQLLAVRPGLFSRRQIVG
jgi:hypothetical protein